MSDSNRNSFSQGRLVRLVKAFRGRRLAVVGDWMLDRYVWGTATRLSPEAAVPVIDFTKQSECLGGAGNVAANLAGLGARVEPFGVTGADEQARTLRTCLRAMKMPERGIVSDSSRPTTLKTRIIARHQQIVRVDRESRAPLRSQTASSLAQKIVNALSHVNALVISDYDKGVVTDEIAGRVLQACRERNIPAFVKPKWSRLPIYRGATAIVCNRAEAGFLVTRSLDSDDAVEEAGRELLAHFDSPAVIITRGERGLSLFEREASRGFHILATSRERPVGLAEERQMPEGREVFDVTGAGDTVLATLALAFAAGASIREAALLGNAAAGIVVGKLGTATLTLAELSAAVRELRLKD
jgi:rfaE bifunctional protein kinase chain/domain